ncbi:MAG: AI-2E family transporter [Acidobacteriota bacterium]
MENPVAPGPELTSGFTPGVPTVGAAQVPAAASPEIKSLLRLAVGAIVIAALFVAQDVLIPLILAVMLSFVLSPLVNLLRRIGLSRAPAVVLSVVLALGVIVLAGMLIGSQAVSLSADAPQYVQTIEQKVQGLQTLVLGKLATVTQQLGLPRGGTADRGAVPARPTGTRALTGPSASRSAQPVLVEIAPPATSPVDVVRSIIAPVLGPLETMLIVLIVSVFILMQQDDLRDRFIRLFGSTDLHRTTLAIDDAAKRLSRYFVSQLAVNATFGVVIGLGLWALGIPSPALWGGVAGLLRFVPYIGPVLAAIAPIALAAAIDPGWRLAIYVALLFMLIEPLTGYVVEPLLYGHSTGLSPLAVIVAAIFWTWIWGPIGLILSTPMTLCLVVMGRHVKSLEFIDVLLGDRPALSAAERFYQRILAGDPDETLAQAEAILGERPLLDYYDGVVLEALKLAAEDEARGTITPARAIEMTRLILNVIGDLNGQVDAGTGGAPVEVPPPGTVACVSGRGVFDDVVAAMLVQLLKRRGVAARLVPHAAVSRGTIGQLDVAGVGAIALSYLDVAGSPAHLRYLIRRLRQHTPGAPIILGLWPAADATLQDPKARQMVGADVYVPTLRDGIAAALTALRAAAAAPAAHPEPAALAQSVAVQNAEPRPKASA